jgi:organic hydroperoxide reductase OsmC/OhrA
LVYLHLAANAGVVVVEYSDSAEGTMVEEGDGGHFVEVVLHPSMVIKDNSKAVLALELHHKVHNLCFIAQSVNFPVRCEPKIKVAMKA